MADDIISTVAAQRAAARTARASLGAPLAPTGRAATRKAVAELQEKPYIVKGVAYTEAEILARMSPLPMPTGAEVVAAEARRAGTLPGTDPVWKPSTAKVRDIERATQFLEVPTTKAQLHTPYYTVKDQPWQEVTGAPKVKTAVQMAAEMAEQKTPIGAPTTVFDYMYKRITPEGTEFKVMSKEQREFEKYTGYYGYLQEHEPRRYTAAVWGSAFAEYGQFKEAGMEVTELAQTRLGFITEKERKKKILTRAAARRAQWEFDPEGTFKRGFVKGASYIVAPRALGFGWSQFEKVTAASPTVQAAGTGGMIGLGIGMVGMELGVPAAKGEWAEVGGRATELGAAFIIGAPQFKAGYAYGKKYGMPVKYGVSKFKQEDIWKGIYTQFGERTDVIVGTTGGWRDIGFGKPSELYVSDFLRGGIVGKELYIPRTRLDREIIVRPEVYKLAGYDPSVYQITDVGIKMMSLWETTPSIFKQEKFLRESSLLTPQETDIAIDLFKTRLKDIEQVYGSFAAQPQMAEGLGRPYQDIDVKLALEEAKASEFAKSLADVLGEKFRISDKRATLVLKDVGLGSKDPHAFDIHYVGEPDLESLSFDISPVKGTERAYGFSLEQDTITIEGLKTQKLSEQFLRKTSASMILQKDMTIGAMPHRAKDISDVFAIGETLRRSTLTGRGGGLLESWKSLHPETDFTKGIVDIYLPGKTITPSIIKPIIPVGYFGKASEFVYKPSPTLISRGIPSVSPIISSSVSSIISPSFGVSRMPSISKSVGVSRMPSISKSVGVSRMPSISKSFGISKMPSISPSISASLGVFSPSLSKSLGKGILPPSPSPYRYKDTDISIPYAYSKPPKFEMPRWGKPFPKRKGKRRRPRRQFRYTPTVLGTKWAMEYPRLKLRKKPSPYVGVQIAGIRYPQQRRRGKARKKGVKRKRKKTRKTRKRRYQKNFMRSLGL